MALHPVLLQYLVYDITSLGFIPQTFNAIVDGVLLVRWWGRRSARLSVVQRRACYMSLPLIVVTEAH